MQSLQGGTEAIAQLDQLEADYYDLQLQLYEVQFEILKCEELLLTAQLESIKRLISGMVWIEPQSPQRVEDVEKVYMDPTVFLLRLKKWSKHKCLKESVNSARAACWLGVCLWHAFFVKGCFIWNQNFCRFAWVECGRVRSVFIEHLLCTRHC